MRSLGACQLVDIWIGSLLILKGLQVESSSFGTRVQLIGVEESCFTLSCRFRNCEDSFQISRGKKQGW